eukprot:CAMPEP_0185208452 /NCGR_PEP_ID=MMETSP1140-20130426/62054_1 /TAXON_ID=298111 /ORGANISM="Pavlova sp., Strain CCMP459" /LENGTH=83 /DNA_ID=CAMNT_0027776171 /DNA_START=377 /DNA_END=628 /DNA_ORIENTATION=-
MKPAIVDGTSAAQQRGLDASNGPSMSTNATVDSVASIASMERKLMLRAVRMAWLKERPCARSTMVSTERLVASPPTMAAPMAV